MNLSRDLILQTEVESAKSRKHFPSENFYHWMNEFIGGFFSGCCVKAISLSIFTKYCIQNNWIHICDALSNLVPSVQFKKREKHLWRSVNFNKVAGFSLQLTKINTPPWVLFTYFKLYRWYQIAQRTTFCCFGFSHITLFDSW